VAQRRRSTRGSGSTRSRRSSSQRGGPLPTPSLPRIGVSPAVARSLLGLLFLVLGAILLVAMVLPGEGRLTDYVRNLVVPFFGSARYLLPVVLLVAGWYLEWGPGRHPEAPWGRTLAGIAVAYVGFLGLVQAMAGSGGRIGSFLFGGLEPLLTTPGSFVLLLALSVAGLLVAFDQPLHALLSPATRAARAAGASFQAHATTPEAEAAPTVRHAGQPRVGPGSANGDESGGVSRRGRPPRGAPGEAPGQTGLFGSDGAQTPLGASSPPPVSATIAPQRIRGADSAQAAAPASAVAVDGAKVEPRPFDRDGDGVIEAGDAPPTRAGIAWELPGDDLLEADRVASPGDGASREAVHRHNEARIVEKLSSFGIEAAIVGRNAGPVVTQYEVQPAPHVKVSRIEALADDLAMALAARSIRIEAPIPGKSAVGIEIPNSEFNVVSLRRIFDEVDFAASGSKLMFALGRDVAGKATAVDLARMPHLLIAGATGSGKSVMVNALITSLLCKADPTEVRMILMDLKRVELAGYNGLPHLYVPVITEPERAKSALKWAVNEMEARYRRFAGATARNIRGYNESRADPADRLPYIVIVIDELADLMMREGKNIEDPIVRLAQKARATGIHMVLATQRPSVNVVTGLIKANFPSRIAFAMASQIDSRTILDSPGAEDLIGRGDMLYQPSDLPRPMRLQGVFVSDPEIGRVTDHWRGQVDGEPRYDLSIITSDEESTGSVDDLADDDADRLLPDAVSVIREYDRASASLLQRRLKIGYARAARIIDQLEARGYVGAFDGSNARMVLRRDDGETADDEDGG
jgi:S-DNA-T family DNA segregation ATPase FtsK/SpoIIIE